MRERNRTNHSSTIEILYHMMLNIGSANYVRLVSYVYFRGKKWRFKCLKSFRIL